MTRDELIVALLTERFAKRKRRRVDLTVDVTVDRDNEAVCEQRRKDLLKRDNDERGSV